MKIGITGGTGFMGSHLTSRLVEAGHQAVLISRGKKEENVERWDSDGVRLVEASVTEQEKLSDAFTDCDAVAHLAGINFQRGEQTYEAVHVDGTENVVDAADDAGVSKVLLSSFLRARPDCGSAYHESKWEAEETVRRSGLDYTVLKAGVTYGQGDHLLNNIARLLSTVPVFGRVGFRPRRIRPLAVEDLVVVMEAALVDGRLSEATVPVVGPEELTVGEAVRRISDVIGRRVLIFPLPVWFHYANSWVQERFMRVPIVSRAQVRMIAEDIVEPAPEDVCEPVPEDLEPEQKFSEGRIEAGISERRRLGLQDLRV